MIFQKKSKDKKPEIGLEVTDFFDLNKASLKNMLSPVHLDVKGNREIVVEGCGSIEEYDENLVRIKVPKMSISFFGRNLEIRCMTVDSLVIEGFVTSIEFST